MSGQVIRFPGNGEPPLPAEIQPDDRQRLGVEVFRGGTYLGTAWRTKQGVTAASAWHQILGRFPDLDSATDAIFAAAIR